MGRYGHHNRYTRYPPHDESDDVVIRKKYKVTEDFDSSKPEKPENVTQDWDSATEKRKASIIQNLKERYQKYNSPGAKQERRMKTLEKRERKIEDLTYKAKKEKLQSVVRKSRQTAQRPVFGSMQLPKHSYASMDKMLGIGGNQKPKRVSRAKPKSNWSGFDRMFGL